MKWILVIIIYTSAPAVTTAEFNDELLCKVAATAVEVEGTSGFARQTIAFCIAKGVEK